MRSVFQSSGSESVCPAANVDSLVERPNYGTYPDGLNETGRQTGSGNGCAEGKRRRCSASRRRSTGSGCWDLALSNLCQRSPSDDSYDVSRQHHNNNDVTAAGDDVAEAPDGGWGWAVVGASFAAHFIADGCGFSFGVLFGELLDVFGQSKSQTAWIGSLFVSVPAICGPIAGVITTRLGCRRTTMIGGLIAGIGCFASSYTTSVGQLCFTFGVVAGFGLSLVYVPAVVVVAFYFEKKRAFATGIAVAGSGIGTFVFAPLTELLIDWYMWRGALIITAGILLNIVVCGAFYRPLPSKEQQKKTTANRSKVYRDDWRSSAHARQLESSWTTPGDICVSRSHPEFTTSCPPALPRLHANCKYATVGQSLESDWDVSQTRSRSQRRIDVHKDSLTPAGRNTVHDGVKNHDIRSPSSVQICVTDDTSLTVDLVPETDVLESRRQLTAASTSCSGGQITMSRRDMAHRGSLLTTGLLLAARRASCPETLDGTVPDHRGRTDTVRPLPARGSVDPLAEVTQRTSRSTCAVDLSVFRSALFNYFCIHTVLLYISYDIPYVYGPVRAIGHGISHSAASFLVSIIGIFSTVGQVAIGYLGDLPFIDTLKFYNSMTSVAGVVTLLVPVATSFSALAFLNAAYGFFISANFALTTVILVELVGVNRLTDAFGIVSLAQGIANLLGPPLAGWLSDTTGSFDLAFYGAGAVIFLSGLMLFAAPCLSRCDVTRRSVKHVLDPLYGCTAHRSKKRDTVVNLGDGSVPYETVAVSHGRGVDGKPL